MSSKMKNTKKTLVILVCILLISFLTGCSKKDDKLNLGKFENKKPDSSKIIKTSKWGKIPSNQFVIVLKDGFGKKEAVKIAAGLNGKVVGEMEYINLYQIENNISNEAELIESIDKAKKNQEVELAFPNVSVYCSGFENSSCNPLDDDFYSGKNGAAFDMIGLKNAWDIIKASKVKLNKVKVGVNDEAFGTKSQETGNADVKGSGVDDVDNNSFKKHSNGVVNIIGADPNNGGATGVASILGKDLSINVINTLDSPGDYATEVTKDEKDPTQYEASNGKSYTVKTLIDLQRQVEAGSKVINCSFNIKPPSPNNAEIALAMKKFLEKMNKDHPDVIFVASAGNDSTALDGNNEMFGHKLPNLITVGATNEDGTPAKYSNFSTGNGEVTVSACGNTHLDLGWNDKGTSFSAPQVTGVAALMKSINPDLSAADIKRIISETASKKTYDKNLPSQYGAGMLRADDAVLKVINEMRKKKNLPELKKEDLLNLSGIELKSTGGPEEFKVTATVKSVSEGGTPLEIEISGSNFAMGGDKKKTLNAAGSVSWDITYKEKKSKLTVKVKRLDTDNCKVILVGGTLKAEDLVGNWAGNVSYDDWSTPIDMARKEIEKNLLTKKGQPLPLNLTVSLLSENSLSFEMKVTGGYPMPPMTFSFSDDGSLSSSFVYKMVAYQYSAMVTDAGDKLNLKGTWNTNATNGTMKMNGQWNAVLIKK